MGKSTGPAPQAASSSTSGTRPVLRSRAWVAPLCWIAVLLDGFDAVVLGAVLPSMLENNGLGITTAQGTAVATVGLVGMMIGALIMGYLTDRLGRHKMLIGAVVLFSLLSFAAAISPSVLVFGVLRFLAGLGLGGVCPPPSRWSPSSPASAAAPTPRPW